ncbi:response regulator transcription factor [Ferrimonas balearica]|nr:response regulator transcription factor [Ferrimonas balearica]
MSAPGGTESGSTPQSQGTGTGDLSHFTFIGSGTLFSDVVLRTIDTEFAGIRATRYPQLNTWALTVLDHPTTPPPPTRLLVVDERQVDDLFLLLRRRPTEMEDTRLALAARTSLGAAKLVRSDGHNLVQHRVSILPMNLHLTAWIQLLRLLDCGEHYLPSCAFDLTPPYAEGATPPDAGGEGDHASAEAFTALTPREQEVLRLVAAGRPNKVIARDLSVSAHTVKLHIHRIMGKLGVSNRTEAAIRFLHEGAGDGHASAQAPSPSNS